MSFNWDDFSPLADDDNGIDWGQFEPIQPVRRGGTASEQRNNAYVAFDARMDAPMDPRRTDAPEPVQAPVSRRGGTAAEMRTFPVDMRRRDAAMDPRRVDIPQTPGQLLEQAAPRDEQQPGLSEREMTEGSIAPWRLEQMRTQANYGDTTRSPVAKPLGFTDNLMADFRDSTDNPVLRGFAGGTAELGKVGVGAVRLAADLVGADDVARFAAGASNQATTVGRGATQDLKGNDKLVADVTSSIMNSVPSMALGMVGGKAMSALFVQSTLNEYNAGRDAGFGLGESLSRASIMGTAEVLGERFGFGEQIKLLKMATKQMPTGRMAQTLGEMIVKEVPGEQLTTAIQFLADKVGPAALKPNATFAEYLEAAGETLKVTIAQAGVMGGGPALIASTRDAMRAGDAAIDRSSTNLAERAAQDAGFNFAPAPQPAAPAAPAPMDFGQAFEADAAGRGFDADTQARTAMDPRNVAPTDVAATQPLPNLFQRATQAPIRVEDMPDTPMSPEQILATPMPAPMEVTGAKTGPVTNAADEDFTGLTNDILRAEAQLPPRVDMNNPGAVLDAQGQGTNAAAPEAKGGVIQSGPAITRPLEAAAPSLLENAVSPTSPDFSQPGTLRARAQAFNDRLAAQKAQPNQDAPNVDQPDVASATADPAGAVDGRGNQPVGGIAAVRPPAGEPTGPSVGRAQPADPQLPAVGGDQRATGQPSVSSGATGTVGDERVADGALSPATAPQPTLLMTGDGQPYGTRSGAYVRSKKEGGEVVAVPGGWAVQVAAAPAADQAQPLAQPLAPTTAKEINAPQAASPQAATPGTSADTSAASVPGAATASVEAPGLSAAPVGNSTSATPTGVPSTLTGVESVSTETLYESPADPARRETMVSRLDTADATLEDAEGTEPPAYAGWGTRREVEVIPAGRNLQTLVGKLDAGKIAPGDFEMQVRMLANRLTRNSAAKADNRMASGRERGADLVRERLLAARRRGELDADTVEFGLWALDKNPAMAEGLGVGVRTAAQGSNAAGDYNPASSVMRLFKGKTNTGTAVHEVLHHTERMMPGEVQDGIRTEWSKSLAKALKGSTPEQRAALANIPAAMTGGQAAQKALTEAFRKGVLDYDTHYPLTNPSEFWAVNATRIMEGRYESQGSWVAAAKQWLKEMLQKVKGMVGMRSDAPVLRGLEAVLSGDGSRQSKGMLSEVPKGGVVEDAAARKLRGGQPLGDFMAKTEKDGSLTVQGDIDAIRAALPDNVKGRLSGGNMVFTSSDAPRARAALEGRKLAYSRAGAVVDKLPMKDGNYLGAPPGFDKPQTIGKLRTILRQLADEGAPGRYWYENSSKAVLRMTGGDVQEARKLVALLAIYSPQAKVDTNSTFALRAWSQHKAGVPISVKTGVMDAKAQKAMDNVDEFWSGEKTGNFFNNLLREIEQDSAAGQGATIDMWMMRAAQYPTDAPTKTQYAFMENENNRLGAELGWEPQQVQAAIWVAMKARMENAGVKKRTEAISEKKKWIRYDYPVKKGKPTKTRVILDAQKHRDNWLDQAMKHDVTKSDTQAAKFDFEDGLRRHIGQISFEARPGRSTGVLPGIHDAPHDQQLEFQQAVQRAFYNAEGGDELALKLGLLVDNNAEGPGVWQGEVSPSSQLQVPMAPTKGDQKAGVDPAQAKLLNVYAAVAGLVARQEGVGWHRPFYKANKGEQNGVDLDTGRAFTPEEAKALWGALDERMKAAGVADWESGAGLISSPTGMRVVNFGALPDNGAFRKLVREAAGDLAVEELTVGDFASDGNLVTNDWKGSPNGEDYRQGITASGPPDLLDWARDVLAPRVQRVFDEYSDRYGWGDPGAVRFSRGAGSDAAGGGRQSGVAQGERPAAPGYGTAREGSTSATAWHFSQGQRGSLSSSAYGRGLKGSRREEFLNAADPRLRKRIYFYVDKGNGINPESGVGGAAHEVQLNNLYDADTDSLGLKGKGSGFESAVADAGFDGYLYRAHNLSAAAVLIGDHSVPVVYRGLGKAATMPGGGVTQQETEPQWEVRATGTESMLQAKLESMQRNPSWAKYDMRVADGKLEVRKQVEEAALSRGTDAAASDPEGHRMRLAGLVNDIRRGWENGPSVVVVRNMDDKRIPERVRAEDQKQRDGGATGSPEGFFYQGKAYLLTDQIGSEKDAVRVLFHEALGHFGLRGKFGPELDKVLDQVAALSQQRVRAKAKEYGLDPNSLKDRRTAAEEVLAEMAQTSPELSLVRRAIAAIKSWARENIPGFDSMGFSDDELVRNFIEPARAFVQRGGKAAAVNAVPAFQRVWHGTPHRGIEKFSTDKIGTGEGAQAYGWGLYFAAKKEIAEHYKRTLERPEVADDAGHPMAREVRREIDRLKREHGEQAVGREWLDSAFEKMAEPFGPNEELGNAYFEMVDDGEITFPSQLYEVNIPEDSEMLLWDKPLSEQSAKVRKAIADTRIATTFDQVLQGKSVQELLSWVDAFDRNNSFAEWIEESAPETTADELRAVIRENYEDSDLESYLSSSKFEDRRTGESIYREITSKLAGGPVVNAMTREQLNDWYEREVGYRPDEDNGEPLPIQDLRDLVAGFNKEIVMTGDSPRTASLYLAALGIKGIKYLDGTSRSAGDGSHNYVIFDGNDTEIQGAMFARGKGTAPGGWVDPAKTRTDSIIYQLQDKNVDLKRVTQAIKDNGTALSDRQDGYLREELYHGRVSNRVDKFMDTELRPLLNEMRVTGVKADALEQYLHARHAEERNAAMMARNPTMANNDALSGMSDADAQAILQAAPPAMVRLAARVDAMINGTRDLMEISGIETAATVQSLRDAWKNYVPLYREDADSDRGPSIGQGFSVKGSVAKRATGSNAKVEHILARIAMEREAVITRAEKNLVGLAVYSMALQNPNPGFWEVDTPPTKRVVDERTGLVVERTDPNYKNADNVMIVKLNGEDRSVIFNEGNERAVRMAKSMKNLDAAMGDGVLRDALMVIGKGTRWIASVNTQYNPVFAIVNAVRDVQGAMVNLTDTPIAGKQAQVMAGAMPALKAVWRANRDPNATGAWADTYREFAAAGGQTGFRELFRTADDRAENLSKEVKKLERGAPRQAFDAFMGVIDTGNTAIENAMRVSAYKAARDQGLSKDQAASVAKNLTVNFNRKGAVGSYMGSLYAFFNAAVQGNARLVKVLAGPKGRTIIAGGIAMGVLQAMLLEGLDDDDRENLAKFDKEKNFIIPVGLFTGESGKVVKIPMALGLHVLPNIGRQIAEAGFALGRGDKADAGERLGDLLATMIDSFNPVGSSNSLLQMLMPTVVDPIVQLVENKDFGGNPIYRERSDFGEYKTGEALGRDNTNPAYKLASRAINAATGGDEFARNTGMPPAASPQPEALRFLVETVGGGVWREIEKAIEASIGAATGNPQEARRLPLIGRFYGDLDNAQAPISAYYDNLKDLDVLRARQKGLAASGAPDADARAKALDKDYPELGLLNQAKRAKDQMKDLREERRTLALEGKDEAKVKEIEQEMATIMRDFNAAMREARRKKD